jgi:hypothetical protein
MVEPCGATGIVERTNAWLVNFRRFVVRYDRSLTIFLTNQKISTHQTGKK